MATDTTDAPGRPHSRGLATFMLAVIPGVLAFFGSLCLVKGLQGVLPAHSIPVELMSQSKESFPQGSRVGQAWRYEVKLQRKDNQQVLTVSCPEDLFMDLLAADEKHDEFTMIVSSLGGEPLSLGIPVRNPSSANPEVPIKIQSLQTQPQPWLAFTAASAMLGTAIALGWHLPIVLARRLRMGISRVAHRPLIFAGSILGFTLGWRAALWG